MTTPKTTINVHPKVFTGLIIGLTITIIGAVSIAITPDSLSFLGPYAVPAASLITIGLAQLGAWLKKSEPASSTDDIPDDAPESTADDTTDGIPDESDVPAS